MPRSTPYDPFALILACKIGLTVDESNAPARRLYEKLGYSVLWDKIDTTMVQVAHSHEHTHNEMETKSSGQSANALSCLVTQIRNDKLYGYARVTEVAMVKGLASRKEA